MLLFQGQNVLTGQSTVNTDLFLNVKFLCTYIQHLR